MVGEIRDKETAEIAIHASLTGHLVLSHHPHQRRGRRRSRAWSRWGSSRSSCARRVIGILAQRLVRMLCPNCKEPYEATPTTSSSSSASIPSASPGGATAKPSPRYVVHGLHYESDRLSDGPDMPDLLPSPAAATHCDAQGLHRARVASTSS